MKKTVYLIVVILSFVLCATLLLASCELNLADEITDQASAENTDGDISDKAGADYDASATGEGENISMTAVCKEIGSMNVSDFEECGGESDYVLIKVKGYGDIVVVLREDVAPISVANFKKLVKSGFYSNTIFHRVIEDFMIQGGGIIVQNGQWMQKSTEAIKGEFAVNGITNNLLHVRGVISMARTNVYDSATSQFFIMHADYPSLNGQYAAFGYVLAGMDVVDAIATCAVEGSSSSPSPVETVVIESVTFVRPK